MTETEWEAGVELDRIVAERVFGVQTKVLTSLGHRSGNIVIGETYQAVAPFSTKMSSAWLIVMQLHEVGWLWQIGVYADVEFEYTVNLYRHDEQLRVSPDIEESANTVSLAICVAALRAKEWEATNGR